MVRRVSKVRKSAILEHLLDLERQIRRELARASLERQARAGHEDGRAAPDDESLADRRKKAVPTEIAQRYLH
jgi:hypothetical protein